MRWKFKKRQYIKDVILSLVGSISFYIAYIIAYINEQCIEIILILLYLIAVLTIHEKENNENYKTFFATWIVKTIMVFSIVVYSTTLLILLT